MMHPLMNNNLDHKTRKAGLFLAFLAECMNRSASGGLGFII